MSDDSAGRVEAAAITDSDDQLRALLEAGRAAWPGVELDAPVFARHLHARLVDGHLPIAHAADLYLACACLEHDQQVLACFESQFVSRLPSFVARIDSSEAFIAEVCQLVRERLLVRGGPAAPKLAEYSGRGALGAWLRVVAIRTALALQKASKHPADAAPEPAEKLQDLATTDPELEYIRTRYATEFRQCFADSLAALEGRARTILRLHLLDGLNIAKIGQLYGVHRATVARWIASARDTLALDTRQRLSERLRLSESEFDSLLPLLRSQMDVSLRRILVDSQPTVARPTPSEE